MLRALCCLRYRGKASIFSASVQRASVIRMLCPPLLPFANYAPLARGARRAAYLPLRRRVLDSGRIGHEAAVRERLRQLCTTRDDAERDQVLPAVVVDRDDFARRAAR